MPAAVVPIRSKLALSPARASGAVRRRASWVMFEIARPGRASVAYGILLADEETNALTFRLRDLSCFDDLDETEFDVLNAIEDDLREKGREMGAFELLEWLEDGLSHFFRVSDRTSIVYSGDASATVDRLFGECVDAEAGEGLSGKVVAVKSCHS